jgi:dienelactone hydrolase
MGTGHDLGARSARARIAVLAAALLALLGLPAAAHAFDAALEAKNFAKTAERMEYVTLTPEFQQRLIKANTDNLAIAAGIVANDPERNFTGNVCANGGNECAGDVRFYDWEKAGMGMVEPVLFTARNGSTISGRVWASAEGPKKRPLIVITNGSVQAPEHLYWGQAATLAKHGYVVLTYDPQGQGLTDTYGAGPDYLDGVPSQEGRPFFDDTEDALDFALSTPAKPYDQRPSCTSGTDHSDKQNRRVAAGHDAAYNPLFNLVDPKRVGIAGHSLGAAAVSYIGQIDPRVDSIVAWDNLAAPGDGMFGAPACASGSSPRPASPPISKPAMGITNDYGIAPSPMTADPDPQTGNDGFIAYKDAGVDSFEFHIRGGTHEESAFIPGNTTGALGLASLRGSDLVAWYTTAWMDRYVRCAGSRACKADADSRLLTDRWRDDERSGQIDTNDDPNVYSFYTRSRYDFHTAGGSEVSCDDMRSGCGSMKPDELPPGYDFVSDAYTLPSGEPGKGDCMLPQRGSAGRDTVRTLPPSGAGDAIRGRGGDDRLRGGGGDDCLYGAGGDDALGGQGGGDAIQGGAGDDALSGGGGGDDLRGGKGADRIAGGRGSDRIDGGPGADVIDARGGGSDKIRCGNGRDRVRGDDSDRLGEGCGDARL